jgi:hypothetical protein
MKHSYLLLLFLMIGFFNSTNAQITFEKSYGDTLRENIYGSQLLSDGGYILCGSTQSGFLYDSTDACVIRLNSIGDTVWIRRYGGIRAEYFNRIQQTNDGGFIMVGVSNSLDFNKGDVYLAKIDSIGNLQWSAIYGVNIEDFDSAGDEGFDVKQTPDGGYILTGFTTSTSVLQSLFLIKTNSLGAVTWSKTYKCDGTTYGVGVENTDDGGYLAMGYAASATFPNNGELIVLKTNSTGVLQWSKAYATDTINYIEFPKTLVKIPTGGYIIGGDSHRADNNPLSMYDSFVLKIDNSGNRVWNKTYRYPNFDYLRDIRVTNDGGFIFTGLQKPASLVFVGYLIKADSLGNLQWGKKYNTGANTNFYSATVNPDNTYSIAGLVFPFSDVSLTSAIIIKTDSLGNSCNSADFMPEQHSPGFLTAPILINTYNGISRVNFTSVTKKPHFKKGTACFSTPCNPNAVFTTSASSNICVGNTITFTNASTNTTFYIWKENDVVFSTSGNVTRTFNNTGIYSIKLVANDGLCADSISITITVSAIPDAGLTASNTIICQGDSAVLTATIGDSYLWLPGGQTTQSITVYNTGNYSVIITNGVSCSDTSGQVTVSVNPTPEPPAITNNFSDTYYSSLPIGSVWYMVGNPNPLDTGYSFTPSVDGDYFIMYTDSNGCTSVTDTFHFIKTGIHESINNDGLLIFPNPTHLNITIKTNLATPGKVTLAIHNMLGQLVYSASDNAAAGLFRKDIDLDLNNGLYFLTLQTNEGSITRKIEIAK